MGKAAPGVDVTKTDAAHEVAGYSALIVGNVSRWAREGRAPIDCKDFQFRELHDVAAETLETLLPDIILSPLFGDDFDVLDVAIALQALAYEGQYRAITEALPNAEMIRAEVRSHAPNLDFDLLMMPPIANDD